MTFDNPIVRLTGVEVRTSEVLTKGAHHMSPTQSWGLLVLILLGLVVAALLLGALLDVWVAHLSRSHDLDDVRRQDEAREALKRIHGRRGGRA